MFKGVSRAAMRPASDKNECFYCKQTLGLEHKPDCVLIKKKVKVRLTVEYEIEVPADWDKEQIEFSRNESSWCSTNAIDELKSLFDNSDNKTEKCMCGCSEYRYLGEESEPYLSE